MLLISLSILAQTRKEDEAKEQERFGGPIIFSTGIAEVEFKSEKEEDGEGGEDGPVSKKQRVEGKEESQRGRGRNQNFTYSMNDLQAVRQFKQRLKKKKFY